MAQAGIPFTTGFLAKLEVVEAAVKANSSPLAVVAMVTAVIAAFFYLRVILLMYSSSAGLAAGDERSMPAGGIDMPAGPVADPGAGGTVVATRPAPTVAAVETEPVALARVPVAPTVAVGIAVCVVVTVLFGVWPAPIVNFAHHALLYAKPSG
jgi:NADH-quinone oxidoreductase subunit N